MTIVIEPPHLGESLYAVTVFPVKDHVKEPPPNSAWKASPTDPTRMRFGWPRFGCPGEKMFSLAGGSMVVAFGLKYPKCGQELAAPLSRRTRGSALIGSGGSGGYGGSQLF